MQSKDATCEVYSTAHTSTSSTETQEVTSLTPLQRTCDSEDKLFYGKLKNVFFHSYHKRILSFLSDVTTHQILQTGNINCHTYRGQSLWRNIFFKYDKMCCDIIFCTDVTSKSDGLWNTGVISGIAAALVLLLILIVVALYINYHHPNTASPLYLIQVSSGCVPNLFRTEPGMLWLCMSPSNLFFKKIFLHLCFYCRDARTAGLPGSFRSNSPVIWKWRETVMKRTALLKPGLIEMMHKHFAFSWITYKQQSEHAHLSKFWHF